MKKDDYEIVTYNTATVFLPEGTYKISELESLCKQMRDSRSLLAKASLEANNGKED